MLKLIYKDNEYFAKTWTAFTDIFKGLKKWDHIVYNHRLNYTCDTFRLSKLTIMERSKIIKNDKRTRDSKTGKRGGLWTSGNQENH